MDAKGGKESGEPAGSLPRALTRDRPRVSYFARHSFGILADEARKMEPISRLEFHGKLCRTGSRRQQGSRVGAGSGQEVAFQAGNDRTLLPEPRPDVPAARTVPGDKSLWQAFAVADVPVP